MYVTLGPLLERLETIERTRPKEEQRDVPTMKELAAVAGITPVSMSRLVTGKVRSLNFETGAAILDELNRRGFEVGPSDILGYRQPES